MADKILYVPDVPRDVKRALARSAREQATGMNDVALMILGEKYGVRVEPTGRDGGAPEILDDSPLALKIPEKLHRAIRMHAAQSGGTMRGLAIATIADALGIPAPSIRRRAAGATS